MRLAALLALSACGGDNVQLSAQMELPSALSASDLRSVSLHAIDQSLLSGLAPADFCTRFICRTSVPQLDNYRQSFEVDNGIASGDRQTLTGLPPNKSYMLLVEASDAPVSSLDDQGSPPATANTARGCVVGIGLKGGQTSTVSACLYFFDNTSMAITGPQTAQCPTPQCTATR